MSPQKSVLWRGLDKVERLVGKPLEELAGSQRFVTAVVAGTRVQRAVGGAARTVIGGTVGAVLHLADVPTRSDVQRLSQHVTRLTGEVRTLTAVNSGGPPRVSPVKGAVTDGD